ncbi:hypothetical protein ECANGB1_711 [Enterospora canceri]|uniref:Translation initiation factor beta propellor-like domain-containing protein n=1 Tax=Enterospora canceri TaxID=1081671 RepID=A0A1Y1S7N5_9MICR|nr:hypothetical protein ECANGB1_711 [Enterospora canceri]
MPVVALSEVGLIIDVFGAKPVVYKATDYVTSSNRLVAYNNRMLRFINLDSMEQSQVEIEKAIELKMGPNGIYTAIKTQAEQLIIYKENKNHSKIENIDEFGINNSLLYYTSNDKMIILDLESNRPIYKSKIPKSISLLTNEAMILSNENKIIHIKGGTKMCESGELDIVEDKAFTVVNREATSESLIQLEKANKIRTHESGNSIVLLVETDYISKTYFAELDFYYLVRNSGGESFTILKYSKLGDIYDVGFLESAFYVVSGAQPARCMLYSTKTGKLIRRIRGATRNCVDFTANEKRVLCGAYGNLPGISTVVEKGEIICQFESLGASIFRWLNDDTHFLVATMNYFKGQNKIDVFDCYGRCTETMECKSLYKVDVFGNKTKSVAVDRPKDLRLIEKTESFDVGSLSMDLYNKMYSGNGEVEKKETRPLKKETERSRTVEAVAMEIEEAKKLRKKMQDGADLTVEEQNKVFGIGELEEELNSRMKGSS